MKKQSLNEHINRMKYLTQYNGKKSIKENFIQEMEPVAQGQPVQGQQQQQPQQPNPQDEANLEREIDIAMNQVIQNLPNELKQADSNHDGQLTVQDGSQPQQPQAAQSTQSATQATTQPVAESEFKQELQGQMNEILATTAGVVAAIPSMATLVGKAASFLGKKVGSGDLAQWGDKAQKWGHDMHHKYINFIGKLTSPFTKNLTPDQRDKVNKMVFYAIVASLFAASIGGAVHAAHSGANALAAGESGLSAIKASELVPAVNEIIPEILAAVKVG